MEVRILRKQGQSLRRIACEVGVSVNTVRRHLANEDMPRYRARAPRLGKLAAFEAYLRERVAAAHPAWIPAAVLYREVKAMGFAGCERLVSRFVRPLRPAKSEDPVVRFETEAGRQMQVDWIEFRREALSAFVATLGHCRASFVCYVADERIETLLACHVAAFEFFGAVPREVLYDNVKTVVIERDAYGPGRHRFQAALWDLAKHYGFAPRLCRPYRARTKGKVERFNRYLRHSFHVPLVCRLRQSGLKLDCDTANFEVRRWLAEVANARVHGQTGQIPAQALIEERKALQPLPPTAYEGDVRRARPRKREQSVATVNVPLPSGARIALPVQHDLSVYDLLIAEAA